MRKFYCLVHTTGAIEFATFIPHDDPKYIEIVECEDFAKLFEAVSAHAVHSRTSDALFVPGIPEARSDREKVGALLIFRDRVDAALKRQEAADA